MKTPCRTEVMERVFKALADRTRLRLLNLVRDQEVCVCFFVDVLDAPQPTISRHLAYLRASGLVKARREGKWMHYRLDIEPGTCVAQIVHTALQCVSTDPAMQRDSERLRRSCCVPSEFVKLQTAVSPAPVPSPTGGSR